MKKEEKKEIINSLTEQLENNSHFYLTDISNLNASDTTMLRRKCFENEIKLVVVKNTLLRKAFEQAEEKYVELLPLLEGPTSILFCDKSSVPAKLIKEFRRKHERPILKGAFVEESVYIGEDKLEALSIIKSKEELIGDLIALLQSPVRNVMSSLHSGAIVLTGVLQTLSEKEN
ncbi:50S ribosomal protein L10 [Bacteroidota bacterium]